MTPNSSMSRILVLLSCCLFSMAAFAVNAPTNLAANATSSSSITLTWTDNSPDEIGFTFMYARDSAFTNPTYIWTGGPNVTSYVHSGRSAGTTYYYRIKAEGPTDPQDSAFGNTAAATTSPGSVSASAAGSSQINVSWSGNSANGSITGYTVATNTVASFSGATYQYVNGAGATSLSKTGLNASTTYYFAVKAEGTSDPYDSPFSGFVNATTSGSSSNPPISTYFWGVNAWMPYQIGSHIYYGSLDNQWSNIQSAGTKIMRYGGNGVDHHADPLWVDPSDSNKSTLKQYLAMVNNMQSRGIEPVLQVPVYGTTYDASDAADIVYYINVTNNKGVKYWSIGNEPDLPGGAYSGGYTTAAQVAGYFKPIASAMKAVDPTIKIIGPDTAWYNETIINGLTACGTGSSSDITGTDAYGRYYVDILAFHHYNGFNGSQSRTDVINAIMSSGGLNDDLGLLATRVSTCNAYRSGSPLKMAVTELNVNYSNTTTDNLYGTGAKSFVGGQWWAEAMGTALRHGVDFVTFWSTIEGSTTNGNELGFIRADGTTKQPSYYHFQMMAQNFRGNSVNATDNHGSVKTFASKASDQTAVLIMNQDQSSNLTYRVRLNTGSVTGTETVKINVDSGLAVENTGTIAAESTILLVFNASGTLTKKIEYKLYGHANNNLPPTVTNYP